MKLLFTILLTAAITGAIVWGVFKVLPGSAQAGPIVTTTVRTGKPVLGQLVEIVSAPGEISPKKKVSISARVSARIMELPFLPGAKVTAGSAQSERPVPASLLVKLDSTDLEAALRSAEARKKAQAARMEVDEAQIESQRASLRATDIQIIQAQRELKRNEGLLASKDVSQSIVDDLRSKLEDLQARLEASRFALIAAEKNISVLKHNLEEADAEISKARENLGHTTIVSPIDGVITKVNTEVGEMAVMGTMNNAGTVILEVADLSKMVMAAQVDESDIGMLKVGQKARVRIQAYPGRIFEGVVDTIALSATTTPTRFFKVEILLDTSGERIYSGLTADVDIQTRVNENVVKIPSQAVLGRPVDTLPAEHRKEGGLVNLNKTITPVVYRKIGDKAVITPIRIGPSDATHTVVLEGLSIEDEVITGPFKVLESIANDQKVQLEGEKKDGAPAGPATPSTTPAKPPGAGPDRTSSGPRVKFGK